jgi:N6-L-threonylcarbamoyladenine synthase
MILASRTLSSSPPKGEKNIVILAIETSCDETSAAVLEIQPSPPPSPSPYAKATEDKQGRGEKFVWPKIKTLSAVVKSQITLHKHMGGVVPETAARAHVKYIRPVVEQALLNAKGYSLNAIDYLAVTTGPGLLPSLMVGVEFAKTLSFATNIPLIPVNHMAGHLYSPFGAEFQISIYFS